MLPGSAAVVSLLVCAAASAQDWRVADGPHRVPAGAYDASRGRVVLVGSGRETREWDGNRLLHRPLPLLSGLPLAMAYDAARRVTVAVVYPFLLAQPLTMHTWECDGTTWVRRNPPTAPPRQPSGSCVYDLARGRVVYVTASAPGGTMSTWEWDGQDWLQRATPPGLTGRLHVSLAYDTARSFTVLFGGLGAGGAHADTWVWNGIGWFVGNPTVSPSARANAAMAYDTARQVCVLFGGTQVADTWEYDGFNWAQRSGPMPPARNGAVLAYDTQRARTVLCGGRGVPQYFHDVWEWDGASWSQRLADVQPDGRALPALAYATARDRLVMFGGDLGTGVAHETWEWDGAAWARVLQAAQLSPPGRSSHSMWGDGVDVFVFGGNALGGAALADTWRWNGIAWSPAAVGAVPPARAGAAVTPDPTGGAILFGGSAGTSPSITYFGDTWRLLGTTWSQLAVTPAPAARTGAAIATDTARQRVVLWGGVGPGGNFDDTWEWDGVAWALQTPVHRPPTGNVQSMAFEPSLGCVVLLTRPSFLAESMETWLWVGGDWVRLDTPTRLNAGTGMKVVAAPGRVFAFDMEHLYMLTPEPPLVAGDGAGCPAATLRLGADTWPRPGAADMGLSSEGQEANAPVLFVVGLAAAAVPVGGCTLRVQPGGPLVATLADVQGNARLAVPLPPVAALVGLRAHAQAWTLVAGGLAATNGLALTIGR